MNDKLLNFMAPASHSLDAEPERVDPCARKHGGNEQSREAFKRCNTDNDRETVYRLIQEAGPNGLTVKECARMMCRQVNQISGRFSELRHKHKLIAPNGNKREGAAAMVALS